MSQKKGPETHGFQTEVRQLLQLMIHSLYSNKEIFLRELISNASDAADKLRFEALAAPDLLEDSPDLGITIEVDKDNNTISVSDNGIGMSRDELVDNLGTIAKSGTAEFLESMTGDDAKDEQANAAKTDVDSGERKPWVPCATYYDEHMLESSVEILGHAVGGVT